MPLHQTVELALKDKAPELHAQLVAQGGLRQYVADLTSQISSEIATRTQEARAANKWDSLGPMECARRMQGAQALIREEALATMLEFPQAGTSPSSGD